MIITVRSGLGTEIETYHSSIAPRTQETIIISKAGSGQMQFRVMDVRHQVQDGQASVELEVMPANEAASDYLGRKINPSLA